MKNNVNVLVAFILGACIGSSITYATVKKKFEIKSRDEIQMIRDLYSEKKPEEKVEETVQEVAEKAKNKPDLYAYTRRISEEGYSNYSDIAKKEETKAYEYIDPAYFGDEPDYDSIFLSYYKDGVLAEDGGDIIEDFLPLVGNFTTHFGEFEEGLVCVVNHERKAYYQIAIDNRDYRNDVEED